MSNVIQWSTIDSEVEEFQNGYRSGFVSIFKKYEGMETDERGPQNKIIVVNKHNFSERYGIAYSTFTDWIRKEEDVTGAVTSPPRSRPGPDQRALEEAAAKARIEAEAKAERDRLAEAERAERQKQKEIEQAEARARKEEQEKAAREKREAAARHQAELKAQAEKDRQDKLEALSRLEARMKEESNAVGFDLSTLTKDQKAQIMTILANDPEQASEWFKAQETARKAKNAAAAEKATEANRKRLEQMEDRERRNTLAKASEDYEHSALKAFLKLEAVAEEVKELLEEKGGVTFSHIISSGRLANEWVTATELVEDVAVAIRESIFEANAESQLQEVGE